MNIQYLPPNERPAHRVAESAATCTQVELLAALIGGSKQVEIAEQVLKHFRNLRNLQVAPVDEIARIRGIGRQTAVRLKAALELGKRLFGEDEPRPYVSSPADAAELIQYEMSLLEQEELWVLLLDTRNRLTGTTKLYRGSLNSAHVRVGEVFRDALRRNAAAVIVAHNHPSGDPFPSPEDIAITRSIREAGELLDVKVLDHLIIGRGRYVSLKERGLGF
jgi:DNA repair protein RadC